MTPQFIKIPAFGNSMYPFFISGDILYIQPISLAKIKINDFITYIEKNIFITHRVIYIATNRNYLLTKGDANLRPDAKVKQEKILGKVIKIERNGKVYLPNTLYKFQSFLYFNEIKRVNNVFKEKKLNYVFLKGLPLHLFYEKTIPTRIYGDCDILVEKKQLEKVENILYKQGYSKEKKHYHFLHRVLQYEKKVTEINFTKEIHNMPIRLDIHVEPSFLMRHLGSLNPLYSETLLESFSDKILREKRTIHIKSIDYPILSPAHLIVYLALHLFHHNFQGYYRYEFLRKILQKEKLFLEDIKTCIQTYKFTSFVLPVFLLLSKYYNDILALQIVNSLYISKEHTKSLLTKIKYTKIFNGEKIANANAQQFKLLFYFSSHSLIHKITIFTSPLVLYAIVRFLLKKAYIYYLYSIQKLPVLLPAKSKNTLPS